MIRVFSRLVFGTLLGGTLFCMLVPTQAENTTGVSGAVWVLTPDLTPAYGAKLVFRGSRGETISVTTGDDGLYRAILVEPDEYTVTVTMTGTCTENRPAFHWVAGATLRFDFKMVVCPSVNFIAVPPLGETKSSTPDYSGMYYKEKRLRINADPKRYLIVAYGLSSYKNGKVQFQPYDSPFPKAPGYLPVEVRVGMFTISADHVNVNESTEILEAKSNVAISDASEMTTRAASCITVNIKEPSPTPRDCKP